MLGYLFGSKAKQNDRSELVVLIRPVVTTSPEEMADESHVERRRLLDGAGYRVHDCRPHATPVKGDQFSVSGRQNRAMTSPLRKKLVDAIIASGCDDPEEQLGTRRHPGQWPDVDRSRPQFRQGG